MSKHDVRSRLQEALGGPWPEPCELESVSGRSLKADGYTIQHVSYLSEPGDRVPALLLIPDAARTRRSPAVCVWHQHNGEFELGKSEPAGLGGNPMHHTGAALAREGFVVLCPDSLGFEERPGCRLFGAERERFLFVRYVLEGRSLAWKNILDNRRAVEFLASRPEVDPERIGGYGHSLGSTQTWMTGPWEPRLKALVGNCCLPTYRGILRDQLNHSFSNIVPGWFPDHDTPDIAALVAPRPLHLSFGAKDPINPIDEVWVGVDHIAHHYESLGAASAFSHFIDEDAGHELSPRMWQLTLAFLLRHLS